VLAVAVAWHGMVAVIVVAAWLLFLLVLVIATVGHACCWAAVWCCLLLLQCDVVVVVVGGGGYHGMACLLLGCGIVSCYCMVWHGCCHSSESSTWQVTYISKSTYMLKTF